MTSTPFGSAGDEQIWESHHLAFGGGKRAYILNGTETTKPDGTPGHVVNYWRSIRARARELIPERPVKPGRDYAITEIVTASRRVRLAWPRLMTSVSADTSRL